MTVLHHDGRDLVARPQARRVRRGRRGHGPRQGHRGARHRFWPSEGQGYRHRVRSALICLCPYPILDIQNVSAPDPDLSRIDSIQNG